MKIAKAHSHSLFDYICKKMGVNDYNAETFTDYAFISIIGSENCQKYYLEDVERHWFAENHDNVLNLEFDDIDHDKEYNGAMMLAMTEQQAEETYNFIMKFLGKRNIYIHCRAGQSRSVAIEQFIKLLDPDTYGPQNPYATPNIHVLSLLKRQHYIKMC